MSVIEHCERVGLFPAHRSFDTLHFRSDKPSGKGDLGLVATTQLSK